MLSIIGRPDGKLRRSGMVLGDEYHIVDCQIQSVRRTHHRPACGWGEGEIGRSTRSAVASRWSPCATDARIRGQRTPPGSPRR